MLIRSFWLVPVRTHPSHRSCKQVQHSWQVFDVDDTQTNSRGIDIDIDDDDDDDAAAAGGQW